MKKVFVCSPYKGDIEKNKARAKEFAKFVYKKGYLPICTQHYNDVFSDELDDYNADDLKLIRANCIEFLKLCDELWVFGDIISEGMKKEIEYSKQNNIKIKFIKEDEEARKNTQS